MDSVALPSNVPGSQAPVQNLAFTAVEAPPQWSLLTRVLFRFAFVYYILYLGPYFLDNIPKVNVVSNYYRGLVLKAIPWVADKIFNTEITVFPNGSGDTTYNYIEVWCFFVTAAACALLWSLIDFRRASYPRLHDWLRIYLRFGLGLIVISYGMVKVIKSQFPAPDLDKLTEPYGQASPMGLLWTFMGYSTAYNIFAGAGEVIGGLLLFWRRTTMLGALILVGVMGHVVALNYCYDVPVKLYSTNLLSMALFLLLPDLRRLINFALLNLPAFPAKLGKPFKSTALNYVAWGVKYAFLAYTSWQTYNLAWQISSQAGDRTPKTEPYGVYDVVEFTREGQTIPPHLSESTRWRRIVMNGYGKFVLIRVSDERTRYVCHFDPDNHTMEITNRWEPDKKCKLTCDKESNDGFKLSGDFFGTKIVARLSMLPEQKFPLTERGFHWINEYPYHR